MLATIGNLLHTIMVANNSPIAQFTHFQHTRYNKLGVISPI